MKKILELKSSRAEYVCDAAVLWCFDHRFESSVIEFIKVTGVVNPDHIRVAGGAKNIASPANESDREFILEQIRKSVTLHRTKKVILIAHSDCGAYGGLQKQFGGDVNAEIAFQQRELAAAAGLIRKSIPSLEVQSYFVDFDGVWQASTDQ